MTKANTTQKNIEKISKLNRFLVSGTVFFMFSYLILLGLTSLNVVSVRSITRSIEDAKNELSVVELSYMNLENVMVLESQEDTGFNQATNIAYVKQSDVSNTPTVAIANTR